MVVCALITCKGIGSNEQSTNGYELVVQQVVEQYQSWGWVEQSCAKQSESNAKYGNGATTIT